MADTDAAKVAPEVAAAPDSVVIAVSAPAAAVSVDVGAEGGGEKACRICHLSPDAGDGGPELIELGCGCKDDLANAHRDCAEAWFKLRGNRSISCQLNCFGQDWISIPNVDIKSFSNPFSSLSLLDEIL